MNAHALLTAQGWRGKGHSLHKTDDGVGLAKPLLLSRKDDTKGLGTTQHFTSDQWWMDAFDEQLQGLDTSQAGTVSQTVTLGRLNSLDRGARGTSCLYASFVRGGFLQGTMTGQDDEAPASSGCEEGGAAAGGRVGPAALNNKETKEERRARRDAKRRGKEERAKDKAARRADKAARRADKARASKSRDSSADADQQRRRRARKEEKRQRRRKESEAGASGHGN